MHRKGGCGAHCLRRQRGAVRTDTVEPAFATVSRLLFIPGGFWRTGRFMPVPDQVGGKLLEEIYADKALMTHVPKDEDAAGRYSSTSQPRVIAAVLEVLQFAPDSTGVWRASSAATPS